MLSHALTIVINELEKHLVDTYGAVAPQVRLANIAEGVGNGANGGGAPRELLCVSMVNLREDKALKNSPHFTRDLQAKRVVYHNPPVFLNFHILVVATHAKYENALLMLSRAIRFFQSRNTFDQDTVAPSSLTTNRVGNAQDHLRTFELIVDLNSPTMEEMNHLWGTLGGKQYPFALYTLRLLEMKFHAPLREEPLIDEIILKINSGTLVIP